jgi:signal transduction histidine kinase
LFVAGLLAVGLPLLLSLVVVAGQTWPEFLFTLLVLPVLPLAYFYAACRRQLGGLEFRANRFISFYFFAILLGAGALVLLALSRLWVPASSNFYSFAIGAAFVAGAGLALFGFNTFQRWVERHVLGIRQPPAELLATYAARLTASPDIPTLVNLLQDDIPPALLIRQSVLLQLEDDAVQVIVAHGVADDELPTLAEAQKLLTMAGRYRPPLAADPCPWVRLALTLAIEHKPIGLWLLGRRDPDDEYNQADISILQTLAHQTAIALANVAQAGRLRSLYQADIEQSEDQRLYLARELHDNLLNELGHLQVLVAEHGASPEVNDKFEALIASLRQMVSDLRPAMLNYGLYHALESLADDLAERHEGRLAVKFGVVNDGPDYTAQVELHSYRIVQQLCENALKHAAPRTLTLTGWLGPGMIDLTIADDSLGFRADGKLDLAWLLAHKHFGLAGVFERAAIIGAELHLNSAPGQGTTARFLWADKNQ